MKHQDINHQILMQSLLSISKEKLKKITDEVGNLNYSSPTVAEYFSTFEQHYFSLYNNRFIPIIKKRKL